MTSSYRPLARRIDVAQALKLRLVNRLSFAEIGKHFGTGKQAVWQALQEFLEIFDKPEIAEAYEGNKACLLSQVEFTLLKACMDEEKIANASLNNAAYAFQQVATQNRLTRGQATQNIDIAQTETEITESRARIQAIQAQIAQMTGKTEEVGEKGERN